MTALREYLFKNGITQAAFAQTIGVSRSYVAHLSSGLKEPSLAIAARIQLATEGKVSFSSLLTDSNKDRASVGHMQALREFRKGD